MQENRGALLIQVRVTRAQFRRLSNNTAALVGSPQPAEVSV